MALTSSTVSSRSERLAHVRIQRERRGQLHDALVFIAQAELARRAQHAVRFLAAQLGALDAHIARQLRADHGDRHFESRAHVFRAAHDLQPIRAVGGHLAHRQFLRIRMAPALEHLADHDARERRAPRATTDSTSSPAKVSCLASSAGVT